MVLNIEYNVSPVSVPTASGSDVVPVGVIDYTVVVTNDVKIACELCLYLLVLFSFLAKNRIFLESSWDPEFSQYIESVLGFFVVKVKLDDHVPQVLMQLYAAATKLKWDFHLHFLILQSKWFGRKAHIRGTLTNGYELLFLILTSNVNLNGKGASYRISDRSNSAAPQETGVNMDMNIPDFVLTHFADERVSRYSVNTHKVSS